MYIRTRRKKYNSCNLHRSKIFKEKRRSFNFTINHFIQRENNFINTINNAHNRSNKNNWVIFGAKPNFPSTGYGYIKLKKIIHKII